MWIWALCWPHVSYWPCQTEDYPCRRIRPSRPQVKHEHVVFHTDQGARIGYVDPRRFGFMLLIGAGERAQAPFLRDLGVEPLSNHFDAGALRDALAGSKAPLKAALLDQKRIAGLGNIYVCEALHRAALSPSRRGHPRSCR